MRNLCQTCIYKYRSKSARLIAHLNKKNFVNFIKNLEKKDIYSNNRNKITKKITETEAKMKEKSNLNITLDKKIYEKLEGENNKSATINRILEMYFDNENQQAEENFDKFIELQNDVSLIKNEIETLRSETLKNIKIIYYVVKGKSDEEIKKILNVEDK
jgi:hypothetical protein